MTVFSPPYFVQGGSHSAKQMRQISAALAGADVVTFAGGVGAVDVGHGLVRPGHLAVTQNGTPNMSVLVAKGTALINGTSSLAQGVYAATNDAPVNLAIAVADATNPRRDLVVMQVRENVEDSSGQNDARLFVVTGTPAAVPVDPVVPAGCLVLARVAVAALASSIVNANITTLAGLATGSAWNQAWGVVPGGYAQIVTNSAAVVGLTVIPGLAISWTAVPGRRYSFRFKGELVQTVASDVYVLNLENTAVTLTRETNSNGTTSSVSTSVEYVNNTSISGPLTWRVNLQRAAGTGTITIGAAATFPAFVIIEDIGPL